METIRENREILEGEIVESLRHAAGFLTGDSGSFPPELSPSIGPSQKRSMRGFFLSDGSAIELFHQDKPRHMFPRRTQKLGKCSRLETYMLGIYCPVLQFAAIPLSFVSRSLHMEKIPAASITIGVRLLS